MVRPTRTTPDAGPARRLVEFLSGHDPPIERLLILIHDFPDPDGLAAAFALQYLASQLRGIDSKIVYGGVIGRTENKAMVDILKIPVRKIRPSDLKTYRDVALVDTQPGFDNNPFPAARRATLVIDQHPSVHEPQAELALIDPQCGATCVIPAQALLLQGLEIPIRVATALAYGILSDTLELYRARRGDIVRTYLDILPSCDMRALARIRNPARSRKFFVTLSEGIKRAQSYYGLIVSHLGVVENPDLVSQMADVLLTYRPVSWSFCTGRYKGKLCVSLRTSRRTGQAGEVLRAIFDNPKDAGGHGSIAGGALRVGRNPTEASWVAAETAMQSRLAGRLRIPKTGKFRNPF